MTLRPNKASILAHVAKQRDRRVAAVRRGKQRVETRASEREIRDSVQRYDDLKHDLSDYQPPSPD